jgi:hypothetical protein
MIFPIIIFHFVFSYRFFTCQELTEPSIKSIHFNDAERDNRRAQSQALKLTHNFYHIIPLQEDGINKN